MVLFQEKCKNLYADVFGHHVNPELDVRSDIVIDEDTRRVIPIDTLDLHFVSTVYVSPKLYNTANSDLSDEPEVDYDILFEAITDNPI